MTVEVDVSQRCEHGCFWIALGSPSQWHLAGAGTISADFEDWWTFHREEMDGTGPACECFDDVDKAWEGN